MMEPHAAATSARQERWLTHYYFGRAAFSAVWVALAFVIGQHSAGIAAALFVAYPAWDALANYIDMSRSGGSAENRTQAFNVVVSVATTIAVLVALSADMAAVLQVFGVWAILSGLLQLGTATRRWKDFGAQWAMILSGAQSALAGAFMIMQAHGTTPPPIVKVAGYAAVGAIYFVVSATWLSVRNLRRKAA
ncbi:DUF308 domain-containing protein [Paraburkholderia rhizosphaerae]|uniref:Short repeat uncharacterized protein DUF308 n=1 Tax=Paraburkholderia rhizosphaerae TaxID=480658 RepID=A0A4R8LZB2_9BURK|nr:DUF308 domain-containing protein [Paraburkholderia rhizosphaerae]TDY52189.1 short repeat uncharacterized protein DUF308 [Paraburkholderia rhizosphaerae]